MTDDTGATKPAPPSRIPWPPILLVAALAGAWLGNRLVPLAWPGLDDPLARVAGYVIGLTGLALLAWGLITLRRAGTTFLPDVAATRLVTHGPFRRWRNPMYVANALILLGLAEITKVIWLVVLTPVFIILVTWLAILPEERHLEERFGDAYRDYKERSRRWI